MESNANLADLLNMSSRTSTFVSVDVAGSTQLKTGQNEQDIIYTFLAYHKLVSGLAYDHHGEVSTISGDGMMCRFQRAEDAYEMAKRLLAGLSEFNKKQNHLTKPVVLRVGIHTGEFFASETVTSGQIISKTLDIAAKLQQSAGPNQACISEATAALLGDKAKAFQRIGWSAALGTNVFAYSPEGVAHQAQGRALPIPAHVLIVEQALGEISKLKKAFFGQRFDTFAVFNQVQANIAIHSWPVHLIVMSLDLSWKTGWELLISLRADPKMSHVPIIAMSNDTTGEIIQRAMKIGANGFLRKPLDEQQINKRAEIVLREFYL